MSFGRNRLWKHRLVEMAEEKGEEGRAKGEERQQKLVLDLCCGTGDIAMMFARRGACVTGVDFTAEMLQVAAARCSRLERFEATSRIQLVQADALWLPFPDNTFEVVSVGYGLRNLADLEAGLREILRVLRPGGKLLSLDFGKPDSPLLRAGFFAYLRNVPPLLSLLFCGDADTHGYIIQSLHDYPAQRGLKLLMEQAGYADCGFEEFCGGAMAINFGSKTR
jgi:demethylmenaquinone methyltransferase/2-methoxy-6-polyprenyl-1,4-benzoquinol methylase